MGKYFKTLFPGGENTNVLKHQTLIPHLSRMSQVKTYQLQYILPNTSTNWPEEVFRNNIYTPILPISGVEEVVAYSTCSIEDEEDPIRINPREITEPDLDKTLYYTQIEEEVLPITSPPASPVATQEHYIPAPPHGPPIVEVTPHLGLTISPPTPLVPATRMDVEFRCPHLDINMIANRCLFTIDQVAAALQHCILAPMMAQELNIILISGRRTPAHTLCLVDGKKRPRPDVSPDDEH